MNFDELNQRITILEHRTVVDEIGNHITKWDEVYSCWAKVTEKSSTETTNTGVTKEIQSVSFVVRQSLFMLSLNATTHKILFRGLVYNIKSVQRDYLHNSYITLVCEVRKAGISDDIY
jgi:SPP1 family predicted phage head-tail adaptor